MSIPGTRVPEEDRGREARKMLQETKSKLSIVVGRGRRIMSFRLAWAS